MSNKIDKDDWPTPKILTESLFEVLEKHIPGWPDVIDVCCNESNYLFPKYITKEMDSLQHCWREQAPIAWVACPYSIQIKFLKKAEKESRNGTTCVVLFGYRKDASRQCKSLDVAKELNPSLIIKFDRLGSREYPNAELDTYLAIYSPSDSGINFKKLMSDILIVKNLFYTKISLFDVAKRWNVSPKYAAKILTEFGIENNFNGKISLYSPATDMYADGRVSIFEYDLKKVETYLFPTPHPVRNKETRILYEINKMYMPTIDKLAEILNEPKHLIQKSLVILRRSGYIHRNELILTQSGIRVITIHKGQCENLKRL